MQKKRVSEKGEETIIKNLEEKIKKMCKYLNEAEKEVSRVSSITGAAEGSENYSLGLRGKEIM